MSDYLDHQNYKYLGKELLCDHKRKRINWAIKIVRRIVQDQLYTDSPMRDLHDLEHRHDQDLRYLRGPLGMLEGHVFDELVRQCLQLRIEEGVKPAKEDLLRRLNKTVSKQLKKYQDEVSQLHDERIARHESYQRLIQDRENRRLSGRF